MDGLRRADRRDATRSERALRRRTPARRRRADHDARPPRRCHCPRRLGLVLAADVVAPLSLPGFDNSAMDGYAVLAADVAGASAEHPVKLPVAEDIPAGRTDPLTLEPGTAHRIMTGAPLPAGATAVVPVEATDARHRHRRDPRGRARPGQHVRRAGEDVTAGTTVLRAGQVVTPGGAGTGRRARARRADRRSAPAGAGDVDGHRTRRPGHAAAARPDLRVQRRHAGRRGPRGRRRGRRRADGRRRRRRVPRRAGRRTPATPI